jgi:hypothetical protein
MARLALLTADPEGSPLRPSLEAVATAGHHDVFSFRAGSSSARDVPDPFDLVVFEVPNRQDSLAAYRSALAAPGLVVLTDGGVDGVLDALASVDPPEARGAVREAARAVAARVPADDAGDAALCLRIARRAIAVIVGSDAAKTSLMTLGCHTPIFVGEGNIGAVIEHILSRSGSPIGKALTRWASALAAIGVTGEAVDQGLGARYPDAVEALTSSARPSPPRS